MKPKPLLLSKDEEYPITKAQVPHHLQLQVTINVTTAIKKYEESVEALGNISYIIKNLIF